MWNKAIRRAYKTWRSNTIPITFLFSALAPKYGALNSAMIAGALCFAGALIAETFAKDLNFVESENG